jgi:hypothetical protein
MLEQTSHYSWDQTAQQWTISNFSTIYYSEQYVDGIHDNSEQAIKIYPNPATDAVTFDLNNETAKATVELFDLQGRRLVTEEFSGSLRLPVNHFSKGLYVYKIHYNGKIQNGKIIID